MGCVCMCVGGDSHTCSCLWCDVTKRRMVSLWAVCRHTFRSTRSVHADTLPNPASNGTACRICSTSSTPPQLTRSSTATASADSVNSTASMRATAVPSRRCCAVACNAAVATGPASRAEVCGVLALAGKGDCVQRECQVFGSRHTSCSRTRTLKRLQRSSNATETTAR